MGYRRIFEELAQQPSTFDDHLLALPSRRVRASVRRSVRGDTHAMERASRARETRWWKTCLSESWVTGVLVVKRFKPVQIKMHASKVAFGQQTTSWGYCQRGQSSHSRKQLVLATGDKRIGGCLHVFSDFVCSSGHHADFLHCPDERGGKVSADLGHPSDSHHCGLAGLDARLTVPDGL